jgi:dolichol kinase
MKGFEDNALLPGLVFQTISHFSILCSLEFLPFKIEKILFYFPGVIISTVFQLSTHRVSSPLERKRDRKIYAGHLGFRI